MNLTKFKTRTDEKTTIKKIVLAGNPNAGKTTLFNALTKSSLRTGNFHGVTTSPSEKTVGGIKFVDVPGAYAFRVYSMEERSAVDELKSADIVVNVIDALTLENSLHLTRQIAFKARRTYRCAKTFRTPRHTRVYMFSQTTFKGAGKGRVAANRQKRKYAIKRGI